MFISKKHLLVAALIAAIQLVATSALTSAWAMPNRYMLRDPDLQRAVVEGYVRYYFGHDDAEIMIAIAKCESTGLVHLNPNGTLRRNPDSGAAGAFQVMLHVHADTARKLKLDINNNLEHYIRFVHHLYIQRGRQPWSTSSGCWSHKVAALMAEQIARRNMRGNIVEVAEARD